MEGKRDTNSRRSLLKAFGAERQHGWPDAVAWPAADRAATFVPGSAGLGPPRGQVLAARGAAPVARSEAAHSRCGRR